MYRGSWYGWRRPALPLHFCEAPELPFVSEKRAYVEDKWHRVYGALSFCSHRPREDGTDI